MLLHEYKTCFYMSSNVWNEISKGIKNISQFPNFYM